MEWLDIESAPKDGTECVFYSMRHGVLVGFIPSHMSHYKITEAIIKTAFNRTGHQFKPTHWMPLPEPPK